MDVAVHAGAELAIGPENRVPTIRGVVRRVDDYGSHVQLTIDRTDARGVVYTRMANPADSPIPVSIVDVATVARSGHVRARQADDSEMELLESRVESLARRVAELESDANTTDTTDLMPMIPDDEPHVGGDCVCPPIDSEVVVDECVTVMKNNGPMTCESLVDHLHRVDVEIGWNKLFDILRSDSRLQHAGNGCFELTPKG